MIYSDILSNIKTVDQARELSVEIDILLDALFKTDANAFEKTLNSISAVTSQALKDMFLKNNANSRLPSPGGQPDNKSFLAGEATGGQVGNYAMIKDLLIGLKEEMQKFKTLKLSLAFEVSEGSIDNLFAWVLTNLRDGIILDIQKDKTILGGAIIEYGGKYRDLSLRKKLEEVFASKREEITKTIG